MFLKIMKSAYSIGRWVIKVATIYSIMNFSGTSCHCREVLHQRNLVRKDLQSRGAVYNFLAASHSSSVFLLSTDSDVFYLATAPAFQFSSYVCAVSYFPSRLRKSLIKHKGGSCSLPELISTEDADTAPLQFFLFPHNVALMTPSCGSY